MKRSEMLKILYDLIDNSLEGYDSEISEWSVDYILQELEKLGMQPPSREMSCGCCFAEGWEEE